MTLNEANMKLKQLENDYDFWLKQKEIALSFVMPKSISIKNEVVDGGKREDKMFKYYELMDSKKIDETLEYIHKSQQNLMNFIDNELKILNQYDPIAKKIYELRQQKVAWWKIGNIVGLCERQCRRILKNMIKKRDFY